MQHRTMSGSAAQAKRATGATDRTLLAFIKRHPGLGIRALARESGRASMTVMHAVWRLRDAGKVQILEYRNSHLVFHAKHARPAPPVAPGLRPLLAAAGGRMQFEVLDTMARRGWSRSTTQHRLGQLVRSGHLRATRRGRFMEYARTGKIRSRASGR
jgi:hypothetical protein